MDTLDIAIINKLQYGFPVCESPYAVVGAELGISAETLICRLNRLLEDKYLSRFGPMFNAEYLGGAVSLAAMSVPDSEFDHIANVINAMEEVAHNYERKHHLNMWFVIATESPEQVQNTINSIEKKTHLRVYNMPKEEEYYVGFFLNLK